MSIDSNIDNHVFLVGRPPFNEFLGVVTSKAEFENEPDLTALSNEWRSANDHIKELEEHEKGLVESPTIDDPPKELGGSVQKVLDDPIFLKSFQVVAPAIKMVELDTLVVFQKHINLSYVESLKAMLGEQPTQEIIFKFCLPYDHPMPPATALRIGQNAFTFISPSTDLRLLEPVLFEGSQISEYRPSGPISKVLGLVVGFGSNFLNAIYANNRLVLNNGSHRAYALRDLGVTHVPCIIQKITRRDELDVIASGDFKEKPERYLDEIRPPLLKDYFDEKLRKIMPVKRTNRQVRFVIQMEATDVPDI